jgi:uncharacterized protein
MEPRVTVVTLGVADLDAATAFYSALGFRDVAPPGSGVTLMQGGGVLLGLWDREHLAEDCRVVDSGGWGGVALAHNVRSPGEVEAVLAEVAAAGARITRHAEETAWGGYSGVFSDPDGHAWQVAYNPGWVLQPDGSVRL